MQMHLWVVSTALKSAPDEFDVQGVFLSRLRADQFVQQRLKGFEQDVALIERCSLDEQAEGWLMSEYDDTPNERSA